MVFQEQQQRGPSGAVKVRDLPRVLGALSTELHAGGGKQTRALSIEPQPLWQAQTTTEPTKSNGAPKPTLDAGSIPAGPSVRVNTLAFSLSGGLSSNSRAQGPHSLRRILNVVGGAISVSQMVPGRRIFSSGPLIFTGN